MSEKRATIRPVFDLAKDEGRAALVVYTTAGFPSRDEGLDALLALSDSGADVLELGVPFSDPLADGPTIQASSFHAIENGVDLAWTLELLQRFTALRPTPVVLFTYLNPVLDYGVERFLDAAVAAGAAGLLLTDLPLGADLRLEERIDRSPLDFVRLIAPTTTAERAKDIAARSQGFVYYISRTGVTGARHELVAGLASEVRALRKTSGVPVAVGFGISTAEQAAEVAAVADGVVVGSAVVSTLAERGVEGARRFVAKLRGAVVRPGKAP